MNVRNYLLLPLLALATGSCTKEVDGPNSTIPRSKVDARINSGLFYSIDAQAQLTGEVLTIIGSRNAANGKGSAIALQLKHYKSPGRYVIDTATQASYTDFGVVYTAETGSVTITEISSVKYAGTFEFQAPGNGGTLSVTKGVIDVYK